MGINTLDIFDKSDRPLVLCLGFFDSLHNGHKALIDKAIDVCGGIGAYPAMFTFDNNPASFLGRDSKLVLTYSERLIRAQELGVDTVIRAHYNEQLMAMPAREFIDVLIKHFNIKGIVAGSDYTFGAGGKGNVGLLQDYLRDSNIPLYIVNLTLVDGRKIASRDIRSYLRSGDIERVNAMLPLEYFITGTVIHGRHQGRLLGFPTANFNTSADKELIADGVYCSIVDVNGKLYKGITNVGTHPTFDDFTNNVETYIIGYQGDLYGSTIAVRFVKRIRGISKFTSKEALIAQLNSDVACAIESVIL
ncbi:MAG: riboflavin biosynthesis protein RibF [Clostridia bacterium]|nr:riboflavin biosynthesis protein RibF [Clostridia bacterium]